MSDKSALRDHARRVQSRVDVERDQEASRAQEKKRKGCMNSVPICLTPTTEKAQKNANLVKLKDHLEVVAQEWTVNHKGELYLPPVTAVSEPDFTFFGRKCEENPYVMYLKLVPDSIWLHIAQHSEVKWLIVLR